MRKREVLLRMKRLLEVVESVRAIVGCGAVSFGAVGLGFLGGIGGWGGRESRRMAMRE